MKIFKNDTDANQMVLTMADMISLLKGDELKEASGALVVSMGRPIKATTKERLELTTDEKAEINTALSLLISMLADNANHEKSLVGTAVE